MTKQKGEAKASFDSPKKPGRGLVKGRPHPFTRPKSRRPIAIEATAPAQSHASGMRCRKNRMRFEEAYNRHQKIQNWWNSSFTAYA
jgi:hypothetical protein